MRRHLRRLSTRLSTRGRTLASGGGQAAAVWESVNALAAQPGMVNMGQGYPDFPGSSIARRVAAEAAASGEPSLAQYTPQPGSLRLRRAVSAFYAERHGASYDPADEVVVTAGGQEALAAAFLAYLDPGDEVVLFEPFYPFMLGAVHLAGAVPRVVRLHAPDFEIDHAALEAACASPRAKMVVLNSPHNPTGHVATAAELALVARLCARHDLLALSDEVYEHAVFDGAHRRLADEPGMRERTISVSSGGKLFSLTGWRVAWACGPAALVGPLGRAHTHLTFSAPTPLQEGIAAALEAETAAAGAARAAAASASASDATPGEVCEGSSRAGAEAEAEAEVGSLGAIAPLFRANFAALASALREGTAVRSVCAAQGGYFLVAETDGRSDVAFCAALAEEKGVVCTPLSVFYAAPFDEAAPCTLVRFTICKSAAHIARACAALRAPPRSTSSG